MSFPWNFVIGPSVMPDTNRNPMNHQARLRTIAVGCAPWFAHFVFSFFLLSLLLAGQVAAQTISVDATPSHVVNSFSPPYALGSTVDRVPSNATDAFFKPEAIKQILSAGWGAISYRQNTELFVQAWHWNPKGTWSDPAGKGYFVGDRIPREMIRHSYGYSLPHRGFTRNGGSEYDGYSRLTMAIRTATGKAILI